ncbi:MAG: glycosyltransferase [Deltaproteobacteria bacterium]|nr:glycosyltransferase [Deltaproteobacteria bacterium]
MKVALIHDWLTGMRGGEKVLEVFCEIFPEADLYTLIHIPGSVSNIIENRKIKTSFVQRLPLVKKRYRAYLPLFPMAIESFNLNGYDLILSSSHCVAKGVIPSPKTLHISYIHTPMRYVWDMYYEYFGNKEGKLSGKAIAAFSHYLRMWDASSSSRVDHYIANSRHVAKRVEKFYRRDSAVINPPVDCGRFSLLDSKGDDFYLIVSAFAPYKRLDIAVEAFNKIGAKLKIIGTGQDEQKLKSMAGANIEFLGWKSDAEIADYYRRCRALIFPGEEDFGIVPLEAMACGRPVIAFGKGGALETIVPFEGTGKANSGHPTGIFFYRQTPEALIEAINILENNPRSFEPSAIRNHALLFDRPIFKEKIKEFVTEKYNEFTGK